MQLSATQPAQMMLQQAGASKKVTGHRQLLHGISNQH